MKQAKTFVGLTLLLICNGIMALATMEWAESRGGIPVLVMLVLVSGSMVGCMLFWQSIFTKEMGLEVLKQAIKQTGVARTQQAIAEKHLLQLANEVDGCFTAAEAEGLHQMLMNAEAGPGSLFDLVVRRLLPAHEAAQRVIERCKGTDPVRLPH